MGQTIEQDQRPITRQEVVSLLQQHFRPEGLGLLARQLRSWQMGCYIGWIFFALASGVITVLALRPALIPYPIVYDPDGRIIWHGTAATTREERFIDVRLVEWVAFARAVSSDETRFREDRERAAAMVYGKAAEKFMAYNKASIASYKDHQHRVFVQIDLPRVDITREGPDRVRITWEEEWTPEFGYGSETHRFQVTMTYAWYARPSNWTLDRARLNPSRVYVTDYFWDELRQEVR